MSAEKETAYKEILPKMPPMRERIFSVLGSSIYGATVNEISECTGIKESTVTGRLDELMDSGRVYAVQVGGKTRYVASDASSIHFHAKKRRLEKMDIFIKRGKKMFPDVQDFVWAVFEKKLQKERHGFIVN